MDKQPYRFAYIDAFAGTGYQTPRDSGTTNDCLFPELASSEAREFLDGSARIALQVEPRFDKYIFIEKDPQRYRELAKLKHEFPEISSRINLVNEDCNDYLTDLCRNRNWRKSRALLFLDPYGMQVAWETVEAIAATKAIDMWMLFPHGIGVNRLLRRDGEIDESWRRRLDTVLGTSDWVNVFYRTRQSTDLFETRDETQKVADFETIGKYYLDRLKTIFAGVAEPALTLRNSVGTPLYLLCFACGNPRAKDTALRIAGHILQE